MENSGDVPILESFGVRFSVLGDPSDDARPSEWAPDVQHIGGGGVLHHMVRNGNHAERLTTGRAVSSARATLAAGDFPSAEEFSAVCRDLRVLTDKVFHHVAMEDQKRASDIMV